MVHNIIKGSSNFRGKEFAPKSTELHTKEIVSIVNGEGGHKRAIYTHEA